MNHKDQSPFTPGSPVPYELFVGRVTQIEEIRRYVIQSIAGRQESIFLSGVRGIGKSSMAAFLRKLVNTQHNMVGIHVFLGGVSTLEEVVRRIFDRLLEETKDKEWFPRISKFFGEHIKQIGLFGISASFAPPKDDLGELVRRFPEALHNLLAEVKKSKSGLFIVLDDINGLAEKAEFANWYKSFVDSVATHYQDFPVTLMLTGLPEKRDSLAVLQPSLMRIFRIVKIEVLSPSEERQFFDEAFKAADMTILEEAMDVMVTFSSGLPFLMHEIGDAVFNTDADGAINMEDTVAGIIRAADNVGVKYLEPKVYNAIRSPRYRSILRKLGQMPLPGPLWFVKKDVESDLSAEEKKVFHNFLKKMRELGVLDQEKEAGPGAYVFTNRIYGLYVMMESRARVWADVR
jgi:hypothetical protein